MQFINIVVHSVENMNFRVHLQFEFTHLGLDKYLGVSMHTNLSGQCKWHVEHLAATVKSQIFSSGVGRDQKQSENRVNISDQKQINANVAP